MDGVFDLGLLSYVNLGRRTIPEDYMGRQVGHPDPLSFVFSLHLLL
jgi:hypothetical protein